MDNSEGVIQEFLTGLVKEALGNTTKVAGEFAQKRFVAGDPAILSCNAGAARALHVCFSGEAIANFVGADDVRLAKLRSGAIEQIRAQHQGYDPADRSSRYPFQILIDYIKV